MKIIIITIITFTFLLDLILAILNYRFKNAKIPKEVNDIYDNDTYNKWQKYYLENFKLSIISRTINFFVILNLLIFNVFHKIHLFADSLTNDKHLQAVILVGFYFLVYYLLNIIFSYYQQLKIEEKYGFNKTTIKIFILDNIKSLILYTLLGSGAIYGLSVLYHKFGNLFYLYALVIIIFFILIVNILYTKIFIKIFNKLKPLENGDLKNDILDLTQKVGYEVKKISIMDASKRSTKLNAFFSGFGKFKHIILFDTLIQKMSNPQILSVLAHEIGHSKKRHTIKNFFISIINISLLLLILLLFINDKTLSISFGFATTNFGFGMLIFFILLSPISIIIEAIINPISRKFEYEADYFASINTSKESMIEALKTLARENFSNLTPHPFYVKLKYTHPPIADRIKAINNIKIN